MPIVIGLSGLAAAAEPAPAPSGGRPLLVIDEQTVKKDEPTPHGKIGMSTAFRISDGVPGRTMEFRKRILHVGSAIGAHPIDHDEVYYVVSGTGEVMSGAETKPITPGMAAYLYRGETVGIKQVGKAPLELIIAYPVVVK
ncbi:cupin domain-containing protein [Sphingomonas naphthae]|uniref:Cupin domain-containing protein n=2 Tax=Sphingomonas naphthae TaxID=1813468 RepID=A0ABY7TRT0_9SPHN|nr:cupin domain-containing protein [Sphingomonas naphthae]WCT75401.1 cupin domain-containing protein [Sphingomonas naphthae]